MARQLAFAGVPLPSLRHIFITHQHSDHTADYGNLIQLAWTAGLSSRVDTWGPPPLARMTQLFFEMNASEIDVRVTNEGRPPLVPLVHVHELREGGAVMSDGNVKVTAALVDRRRCPCPLGDVSARYRSARRASAQCRGVEGEYPGASNIG